MKKASKPLFSSSLCDGDWLLELEVLLGSALSLGFSSTAPSLSSSLPDLCSAVSSDILVSLSSRLSFTCACLASPVSKSTDRSLYKTESSWVSSGSVFLVCSLLSLSFFVL